MIKLCQQHRKHQQSKEPSYNNEEGGEEQIGEITITTTTTNPEF